MEQVVGVAVFRDARILLVQRSMKKKFLPGYWEIPGGHVEEGETPEAAARRELEEETGLIIKRMKYYNKWSDGRVEETDFIAEASGTLKLDSKECSAFVWASPNDIKTLKMSKKMKETIGKAFGKGQ